MNTRSSCKACCGASTPSISGASSWGKELAETILGELGDETPRAGHDGSTTGLIDHYHHLLKEAP